MSESEKMKNDMVKELALLLIMRDSSLSMKEALAVVFNSDTYQKVLEDRTRLYYQSPGYVFSFLENELRTGKMG